MSQQFSVGEIVFAKIKGYRPWPAVISYVSTQSNGKINYHVVFYGTGNSSVVGSRKIWSICDKMAVMGNPRKCKRFAAAIKDMMSSLELEDPCDKNDILKKINDTRKKPTPKRELNGTSRSLTLSLGGSMTLAGSSTSLSRQSAPFNEKYSFKTSDSPFATEVTRMSKCIPLKKRIIANLLFDSVEAELRQIQGRKEAEKEETDITPSSLGQTLEEILTGMYEVGKTKQQNMESKNQENNCALFTDRNHIKNPSERNTKRKAIKMASTKIKRNTAVNQNKKKRQNSFTLDINDPIKELRRAGERYVNKSYRAFDRQVKTEQHKQTLKSVREDKPNKMIEGSSKQGDFSSSIGSKVKGDTCVSDVKGFEECLTPSKDDRDHPVYKM